MSASPILITGNNGTGNNGGIAVEALQVELPEGANFARLKVGITE